MAASASKSKLQLIAEPHIVDYYREIEKVVDAQYNLATEARQTGLDVSTDVESTPTVDLADRCENIVGPPGIANRYREVIKETKGNRMKAIFQIFREILEQKWVKIEDRRKRLEQAVKTCLVIQTEGVVVAPLDGVPEIKISRNFDGTEYVDIFYAGPIRAAGGTATVLPLILGDYARKLMGLDVYKPTEDEIERYVEEMEIYDEIFSRQYRLKPDEIRKIARNCPVCINGVPTEIREVSVHKNLGRIPSNRVRGGACLVISEGLALKALKVIDMAKVLGLDWRWLEDIAKVDKNAEKEKSLEPSYTFLTRLAAGRPIFCYPSRFGGFRLRYGRARNTGIMAKGIHPATMYLLDEFVAVGTQLKVEKPGKSAGIFPCDSVEGPIVKLLNGEVRKIETVEEAMQVRHSVDKILFLGDILVSYGDFRQTAYRLLPAGYCTEWWLLELENVLASGKQLQGVEIDNIFASNGKVDPSTAIEISMQLGIPLHPDYIQYFSALTLEDVEYLVAVVKEAEKIFDGNKIRETYLPNGEKTKDLLERIGLPHRVAEGRIIIEEKYAYPFLKIFGAMSQENKISGDNPLDALSRLSGLTIRDKAGTFIGTRMGRPEASRPRKMVGNPHVLFPIGLAGASTRSINKAMLKFDSKTQREGVIEVEIATYECLGCKEITAQVFCKRCNKRTERVLWCENCTSMGKESFCKICGNERLPYRSGKINVKELVDEAASNLGARLPDIVKGVKGLINDEKIAEPLEKGILRAIYDLHPFRDGTIRYEVLNAPLTHFKPAEIGTSVEQLRQLGYAKDRYGKELANENQLVEILPQDLVLHEDAGDFFVRVCKFADDLLTRFYHLQPHYNVNNKAQLIGQLLLGLAPHTSAAIVGRVIGYTKARVCFAHPYFHQTKRRNIDGDQDSLMLLMDCLLNFSESYLSKSRGGRMDAPIAFTIALNPTEIDDEVHNMECGKGFPIDFYEKTWQNVLPQQLTNIEKVKERLNTQLQYSQIWFTHETSDFSAGPKMSKYVQLQTMEEKIKGQAVLQGKIAAVDKKDALERVLMSHFLPDIIGNARGFSRQVFRCSTCNAKFRRVPLRGKCIKCNGHIILTIAQGSVRKYLNIAKEIVKTHGLSDYIRQRLELTEKEIDSIFAAESKEQKSLVEYV